jgi:outer membrane protein assembly factor BamB
VICDTDGTLLANIETGGEFWIGAAASDGVGFFADAANYISAYNLDATLRWHLGLGGKVVSSPVTTIDGTVYFGSEDSFLYAVLPDGSLKWRYQTGGGIGGSPLVRPDGTILVGSKDHKLHAVSPAGAALWQFETGNWVAGSPALGPDGRIYFGSNDHNLYALNQDGTLAWSFPTSRYVTSSPTVDTDGKIYFGSWNSYIYCLSPDGTEDWSFLAEGPVRGSVAVQGNILYAACDRDSDTGSIFALTMGGAQLWAYVTVGQAFMSPAVGVDGTVYVTTALGQSAAQRCVYAVQSQNLNWQYSGASAATGIALDSNGVLFAGMADGRMLALDDSSGVMQVAWTSTCGPANFYTPAIASGRTYVGYDAGIYAFGDN